MAPARATPFRRPGWVYEEKVDGWRIVAHKDGRDVRLISRTGTNHTARFPSVLLRDRLREPVFHGLLGTVR